MSTEATLAAGTVVSYSLSIDTPAYTVLNGVMSVGAVGYIAEAKPKTTLADLTEKNGAGMKKAPDKTIKGQYFGSDTNQQAFLDAVDETARLLIKVEYPDKPNAAGTGTVAIFELATLGFELDDVTGEDWMMFTVSAKQNTLVFTKPVTG